MLPVLTRDQILAQRKKHKTDYVEIPDVGLVRIRELTAGERRDFDVIINRMDKVDPVHLWEYLAQCGMIDENGKNLFSSDDRDVLSGFGSSFITPIAIAVRKLSGMDEKLDDIKSKSVSESDRDDDTPDSRASG